MPLLLALQALIERSYDMPRVVGDAGRFLIGDQGLRALYDTPEGTAGARLLVRHTGAELRASLYYPDSLVRLLERDDPRRALHDANFTAFAILVEELDHLLVLASRAAEGRAVTLLELEVHALVTKYLVSIHFLGRLIGRRRVPEFHRLWIRHHLFARYAAGPGEDEARYREAARLAGRYVAWLDILRPADRRAELRAFHARAFGEQVRLIQGLD